MNIFLLVWSYLKAKPVGTFLNALILALGIALITTVLLFDNQLQSRISGNAKGIDLVVGAKGSPLQLILCNIFHVDFPTGNIKLKDAEQVVSNGMVKKSIPLALGDSYQGYRVVGTSEEYPALYEARLAKGAWWKKDFEVTIGANVASNLSLSIGDVFSGSHGFSSGGDVHEGHSYQVAGVMQVTNTVLDNLVLCSVESVWLMHDDEHQTKPRYEDKITEFQESKLIPGTSVNDTTREVTSLLIQYRTPLGAIQLSRLVNSRSNLQAASPAFEIARLFSILGVGVDILRGVAVLLIVISALSLFIALYNSLSDRKYDLAIMRTMGATRSTLVAAVLLEGSILTIVGCLSGLFFAHLFLTGLFTSIDSLQDTGFSGWVFLPVEGLLIVGSLVTGIMCALIPAVQAYQIDISKTLADN